MRRYVFTFLVFLITVPAIADNWIKFTSQAVENTINTIVVHECRQAAADEYQKQMDQTSGKISVTGIYKVCSAACKDIRSNKGYSDCRYFINQMAEKSGFGVKSATKENCASQMNGIWTLSPDGKQYQCVGKDGFKLVYLKSCDNAGGDCIKDFSELKTQGPVGREFIAEYAKKKNLNLTCKIGFEFRRGMTSPLGQDYIMCSAGGKAYEFEFDSLNETPGKTSVESENKILCEFFGGKIVKHPDNTVEKDWQSCDIDSDVCNSQIHNFSLRIGHNNMYQGYCRLSRTVQSNSKVFLNQIAGVDSYVFYKSGAQMRADMAKVQLEEYLRNTFPKESYINCDSMVKTLEGNGFGIDVDYLLTCTVGTKTVDFVFDDLTESSKRRADTGMDAMQCITSGGTFKGESCRGPTQDECTKLDATLRAKGSTEGAFWDNNVRACILGNAMKTYKTDVVTNYIVGAVVIVGGTFVVIGTGGVAMPVVVGGIEMLAADMAINYAIDANHRRLSKAAANRFGDFIDDADKCTDEQCALNILKKHYATLLGVMNDLNKDDRVVIEEIMDRLVGLIKTEFVACGKNDSGQTVYAAPVDCAKQSSTLRAIDYIDKASEPVLIIGTFVYNPGFVTTRFMKIKNISKVAKNMGVTYKEAKQIVKSVEQAQKASKAATKTDNVARTTMLNGLDPNFTHGTSLDPENLQVALEITADELYAGRFLEGNANISQGMITDVTTAVNKHYAQERNILFFDPASEGYIDDIIRQADNVNTDKVITGVVDMTDPSGKNHLERAIQTIEEGGIKDAVIPIGAPGHQMTLIKQGDEWTVLDQYAYAEPAFKETKDVVIGIVGKNAGSKEKVVTNIGQVCDNTTGSCALFSQGMGRIVLEETDGIKIADEVRLLNQQKIQMNQSFVDDIVDQMDRDVGLRVLDMLE